MPPTHAADWRSELTPWGRAVISVAMVNFLIFFALRVWLNMGALSGYRDETGSYMKVEHSSKMVRVDDFWWRVDRAHSMVAFYGIPVAMAMAFYCQMKGRDDRARRMERVAPGEVDPSDGAVFWRSTPPANRDASVGKPDGG